MFRVVKFLEILVDIIVKIADLTPFKAASSSEFRISALRLIHEIWKRAAQGNPNNIEILARRFKKCSFKRVLPLLALIPNDTISFRLLIPVGVILA